MIYSTDFAIIKGPQSEEVELASLMSLMGGPSTILGWPTINTKWVGNIIQRSSVSIDVG